MIDVTKRSGHARAVDWIDIIMYVFPTIVVEQLRKKQTSDEAIKAFMSLIQAITMSLSWSISDAEITKIKK